MSNARLSTNVNFFSLTCSLHCGMRNMQYPYKSSCHVDGCTCGHNPKVLEPQQNLFSSGNDLHREVLIRPKIKLNRSLKEFFTCYFYEAA